MLKQLLSEQFRRYAASFVPAGETLPGPMELKVGHTFDVCSIMERIAAAGEPTPERRILCWICALFHDVSRFEQYQRFKTFRDDRSFDHGQRSAEIFKSDFPIPSLSDADRDIICKAIMYHNKPHLPETLRTGEIFPAKAIRDADKISIMKLLNRHFENPLITQQEVVNLGMEDTPGFTESVAQTVLCGGTVLHREMRNVNDFKLTVYAWTSDFNFPESAKIVLEEGLYDCLRTFLPESPILDEIHAVCMKRLTALAGKGRECL